MAWVSGLVHMFEYHVLQYKDANIGYPKIYMLRLKSVQSYKSDGSVFHVNIVPFFKSIHLQM